MEFDMMYDEERIKLIMSTKDFGDISKIYHDIQEMYPLKLKILKKMTCKRCGFCCKSCNAMMSKQDIDLLCKYLQCTFEELYEKYMDKSAKIPYLKLPCPFLNEDNDCEVYPARPKVCREFPFNEFTAIVDPCRLGKDIRGIIEEIEGPITEINEDMQKVANQNDEFFEHMINKENNEAFKDTGKHLRLNIDMNMLEKMMRHMKYKKKKERKK